jgi:hypothetical protein
VSVKPDLGELVQGRESKLDDAPKQGSACQAYRGRRTLAFAKAGKLKNDMLAKAAWPRERERLAWGGQSCTAKIMNAKMSKPSSVGLTRVLLGTMKAMRGQCEAVMTVSKNVPLLVTTYACQDDWIAFVRHCARTEPGLLLLLLTEAGQGVACVAVRCLRMTYMRAMRGVGCEEACEAVRRLWEQKQ